MNLATAAARTAHLTETTASGSDNIAEQLSDSDGSLPSEQWFISLALGIRCDSTITRQPSIDPTTLCFNDRELESAWWHKQAASALEDDRNDTTIFTCGTLLTLLRLWYIGALSHSSAPTQDFTIILIAAVASFSTSVWHWILLRSSRQKYTMARQPWAMWTRFARCSFACATTPHLFLAQPDSPSIMLSLVQASLTTGFIPLLCQQGIVLRYRHHLANQFLAVLLFMLASRRNCTTYFTASSHLGAALEAAGAHLAAGLGLPPALFADISLAEWLHLGCQVLLGFVLTCHRLYHRELAARAHFLAGQQRLWLDSTGSSRAGSSRARLEVPSSSECEGQAAASCCGCLPQQGHGR